MTYMPLPIVAMDDSWLRHRSRRVSLNFVCQVRRYNGDGTAVGEPSC